MVAVRTDEVKTYFCGNPHHSSGNCFSSMRFVSSLSVHAGSVSVCESAFVCGEFFSFLYSMFLFLFENSVIFVFLY